MFSAAARGIPSFGDLAWKKPCKFANDPNAGVGLSAHTTTPGAGISFGQTMEKNTNGALTSETTFGSGAIAGTLSVGDRVLITSEGNTEDGIWTITALGSGAAKWKLTRATDADTAAELPVGSITVAAGSWFTNLGTFGGLYTFVMWQQSAANTWTVIPQSFDQVISANGFSAYGSIDLKNPATGAAIGSWSSASFTLDQFIAVIRAATGNSILNGQVTGDTFQRWQALVGANGGTIGFGSGAAAIDTMIARTGAKAVQYDDGAGGSAIWATKGTRPGMVVHSFKGTIASGTATLTLDPVGAAVAGNGLIMPWAGKIIAVSARTAAARTAGSATCTATIGGTNKTTASAVIDGTNPNGKATAVADAAADTFTANSALRAQVVTAGWTPTANAIQVDVYILYDAVG